jgi:iron complex transport system substrate-binding protein
MKKLVMMGLLALGLAFAQEEPYQVPGFPPFAPEPHLLEVLERDEDTVRVRHAFGEVEVPAEPLRIIAADLPVFGMLVSLGVPPVGVVSLEGQFSPALEPYAEGVTILQNPDGVLSLEPALSLEPDLIIGFRGLGFNDAAFYEPVSRIAPTIALLDDPLFAPRQGLRDLGELLGRVEEAEEAIADYESFLAEKRSAISERLGDATFSILRAHGERDYALNGVGLKVEDGSFVPHSISGFLYDDLRLQPGPEVAKYAPDAYESLSLEVLPELQADHLLVITFGERVAQQAELSSLSLWQQVKAVQEGNVHFFTLNELFPCGLLCNRHRIELFTERVLGATD